MSLVQTGKVPSCVRPWTKHHRHGILRSTESGYRHRFRLSASTSLYAHRGFAVGGLCRRDGADRRRSSHSRLKRLEVRMSIDVLDAPSIQSARLSPAGRRRVRAPSVLRGAPSPPLYRRWRGKPTSRSTRRSSTCIPGWTGHTISHVEGVRAPERLCWRIRGEEVRNHERFLRAKQWID